MKLPPYGAFTAWKLGPPATIICRDAKGYMGIAG